MSGDDPRDDLDVIRALCQGQLLTEISKIHERGASAASDVAIEGYLDGVTTWLLASVGPGKALNMLMRFADRASAEMAVIARENQQRENT